LRLIAFKAVSKHTTVQRVDLIGVNRLTFANEVLPSKPSQADGSNLETGTR